jgi:hypothetical protein
MGTHFLERTQGGSSQETAKKQSERRALTNWRGHREGHVRKGKETGRVTGTHGLEKAQGESSQEKQRN